MKDSFAIAVLTLTGVVALVFLVDYLHIWTF